MTKQEMIDQYIEKVKKRRGITKKEAMRLKMTKSYIKYVREEGKPCQIQ